MRRPSSRDRFSPTLRLLRLSSSNGGFEPSPPNADEQAPERIAVGRLDLHDVGAPVAEHRRRRRSRHPHADLDDPDAFHRSGHERSLGRRHRATLPAWTSPRSKSAPTAPTARSARITLNRPDKLNPLSTTTLLELVGAAAHFDAAARGEGRGGGRPRPGVQRGRRPQRVQRREHRCRAARGGRRWPPDGRGHRIDRAP